MLFRLLLLGLLLYLGMKLVQGFMKSFEAKQHPPKVRGTPKGKPPLNLDEHDVEDADYEDLK